MKIPTFPDLFFYFLNDAIWLIALFQEINRCFNDKSSGARARRKQVTCNALENNSSIPRFLEFRSKILQGYFRRVIEYIYAKKQKSIF